jgi:hypothetical protein
MRIGNGSAELAESDGQGVIADPGRLAKMSWTIAQAERRVALKSVAFDDNVIPIPASGLGLIHAFVGASQ